MIIKSVFPGSGVLMIWMIIVAEYNSTRKIEAMIKGDPNRFAGGVVLKRK